MVESNIKARRPSSPFRKNDKKKQTKIKDHDNILKTSVMKQIKLPNTQQNNVCQEYKFSPNFKGFSRQPKTQEVRKEEKEKNLEEWE